MHFELTKYGVSKKQHEDFDKAQAELIFQELENQLQTGNNIK